MTPEYELKVTETESGNFRVRIKCPDCDTFVVPKGIPLKIKYMTDTGKDAISEGYMFLSPGKHACDKKSDLG